MEGNWSVHGLRAIADILAGVSLVLCGLPSPCFVRPSGDSSVDGRVDGHVADLHRCFVTAVTEGRTTSSYHHEGKRAVWACADMLANMLAVLYDRTFW